MASKEPEEPSNTENEEETIAFKKKRSRRVSFVDQEVTSVHYFNRDEDYETPPEAKPSSESENAELGQENDVLLFLEDLKELSPNDDDDDDNIVERKSFLQPIGSPGSITIGSATSIEEDDFFGPVSSSFIRPGRLSDSAASDENHDVTMDSTAFSMHFRSLARSESGDLKSPSAVRLAFVEKTPTQRMTPTDAGSLMVLTREKKLISQADLPVNKTSGSRDSNDMSLVGENPHRYDYARLSPTLDALLAEGSKDLHVVSVSDPIKVKPSNDGDVSAIDGNWSGLMTKKFAGDIEMGNGGINDRHAQTVSTPRSNMDAATGGSKTNFSEHITYDGSLNANNDPAFIASVDHQMNTLTRLSNVDYISFKDLSRPEFEHPDFNSTTPPNMGRKILQLEVSMKDESEFHSFKEGGVKENSPLDGSKFSDTNKNSDQQYGSPLAGSRRQIFVGSANSSGHPLIVTPLAEYSDSVSSKDGEKHGGSQLEVSAIQSEIKYLTKGRAKENFPEDGLITSDANQNFDRQYGSPLAGSTSSLSAKRKQIFVGSVNSPRYPLIVTPSADQPGSVLSKKGTKYSGSQLEVSKNKESGFQCLTKGQVKENSPRYGRIWSDANQNSARPYGSPLAGSIASLSAKRQQILLGSANSFRHPLIVTPSEEHPGSVISKKTIELSGSLLAIQKSISKLKSYQPSPYSSTLNDGIDKLRLRLSNYLPTASPLNFVLSENRKGLQRNLVDAPVVRLEDYLSTVDLKSREHETIVNMGDDKIEIPKTVESIGKFNQHEEITARANDGESIHDKRTTSTEYQYSHSSELKQQDEYSKHFGVNSGHDGDSVEISTNGSHITAISNKLDRGVESSSPVIEMNHLKVVSLVKGMDNEESDLHMQNELEAFMNFQIPSRDTNTLHFQLESPDRNHQTQTDPTCSKEESLAEVIKVSSRGSVSPHILGRSANVFSHQKSPCRKELFQSPSKKEITQNLSGKELDNASLMDDIWNLVRKGTLSPKTNSEGHMNDDHISGSPLKKRRSDEIALGVGDHKDKISRTHRTQEARNNEITDDNTTLGHWTDILPKFSGETEQLLSPLVDKLNIRAIGMLEDILVHLEKAKLYETLCSEMQSQKTFEQSSKGRHKRVAESRLLLYKMMYGKVKLLLMCMKRERLQKRFQLLKSGIQESQVLKLNHIQLQSVRETQGNDSSRQSCVVNNKGKHEVFSDKVTTMRQESELLERKIKNLTKSLHSYCKMKGESNAADTMVLINETLKKRMYGSLLRQDLQLWEVGDLESRNGHHDVVLNYQGFIFQRFTLNVGPTSSITILSKSNDIDIVKNFPNMDVSTVFAFVLHGETTKKYAGSKNLAQETQITSSVLRNLLQVIYEVQLARLEIRNLAQTRFYSPSVEQLDLQLSFIDFNSGMKVTLTLDMTCLSRGIYPSEVLPYRVQAQQAETRMSPAKSVPAEIRAAADSLRAGYARIIRLCRCVSDIVQPSER